MEERRTFRERAKGVAKASAKLLKKLSPERAISRIRLNFDLDNALSVKAKSTDFKLIMELVQKGANPNLQTMEGYSPLLSAALEGNAEACAFFIEKGADISAANKHGQTPLYHAARHGHTEICALLIIEYKKAGGDVKKLITAKDGIRKTALHLAAEYNFIEACILLIDEYAKAGGNVNKFVAAKDDDKNTALHLAAWDGRTEICALLIANGADIAAKNNKGKTAMDFASGKNARFLESIEKLSEAMGKETFNSFTNSFTECVAA
jgi:ankyrin repeat protein